MGWVSACKGDSHLAGVLASLEEASADHVFGDLSGVRVFTLGLAQQRGIQALQQLGVVGFGDQGKKECGSARLGDGHPGLNTEGSRERTPRT